MPDSNDWNRQTIEAFRANGGKVGGIWEGRPLLLLTTTGAKSSQRRTSPVMYLRDSDRLLVFASKGGEPTNPDWYHNLLAHPEVTVEVGNKTYDAIATPVTGEERDRIYDRWAEMYPKSLQPLASLFPLLMKEKTVLALRQILIKFCRHRIKTFTRYG